MALTLFLFLGSAALIYLSCKFFVNGVEWVGARLNVSQTATGTILAAFGTALPESVVTFVAIGTTRAEREIGVGATMGGPLVLSTLAYGIVGLTLLGSEWLRIRRKDALEVDYRRLSRDQGWFLIIFTGELALGLVAFPGKPWLGFLFLAAYALYVWKELGRPESAADAVRLEPLKIRRTDSQPALFWALVKATDEISCTSAVVVVGG
jgi:cation:H+ antiporter